MCQYLIPFHAWIISHCMAIPHLVYTTSSADVRLGCFCFLVIVSSAEWTSKYKLLFEYLFLILLDIYLGVELQSHMVIWCLAFWGTARLFSTVAAPFCIPTCNVQGFNFSTSSPTCITVHIFILYFLHLFIFDRDRAQVGEGQREKETRNPKQAPGSELSAQSPTQGSNSQTTRSWPEPKSEA